VCRFRDRYPRLRSFVSGQEPVQLPKNVGSRAVRPTRWSSVAFCDRFFICCRRSTRSGNQFRCRKWLAASSYDRRDGREDSTSVKGASIEALLTGFPHGGLFYLPGIPPAGTEAGLP